MPALGDALAKDDDYPAAMATVRMFMHLRGRWSHGEKLEVTGPAGRQSLEPGCATESHSRLETRH